MEAWSISCRKKPTNCSNLGNLSPTKFSTDDVLLCDVVLQPRQYLLLTGLRVDQQWTPLGSLA